MKEKRYRGPIGKEDNCFSRRRPTSRTFNRIELEMRAEQLAATAGRWSKRTGKPVRLYFDRVAKFRRGRFVRVVNLAKRIMIDSIDRRIEISFDPRPVFG